MRKRDQTSGQLYFCTSYCYAKTGRGLPEQDAFALIDSIWRPGSDWADFIGEDTGKGQTSRYAGDEH